MIYAIEAREQLRALRRHFEQNGRDEAVHHLAAAMLDAERRIEANPHAGLPAPRPHPALAESGRAWINSGRYWIAYGVTDPPMILAVFFEQAHIPGRPPPDTIA